MFSTSFKIVIGYILLVGLLIGAFTYTMQQMNLLTTPTSLRDQLDHGATSLTVSSASCMTRKVSGRHSAPEI